ncbi:hypothetical protein [Algivirga pacifica]|uniref:Uncharacterized protein n=1 Tax=Algivirga pacifica TaxID=1162670 RepID=A0ABP9DF86_9BACT
MNRADIEQSNKGNLSDLQGHKNLLVSFGGVSQGLGVPVFEFFNSIADIPCDKIFLRDFHQAWYQKGVDEELNHVDKVITYLQDIISTHSYERVCFIGNSMGGYAALLFGSILNVDQVIAFAPQTFIDKWHRFLYRDRRWKKELAEVYTFEGQKKMFFDLKKYLSEHRSSTTQLSIYYAHKHRLDRGHAKRLKSIPNVVLHPVKEGGHEVVKAIRNKGELKAIIRGCFEA